MLDKVYCTRTYWKAVFKGLGYKEGHHTTHPPILDQWSGEYTWYNAGHFLIGIKYGELEIGFHSFSFFHYKDGGKWTRLDYPEKEGDLEDKDIPDLLRVFEAIVYPDSFPLCIGIEWAAPLLEIVLKDV